MSVKCPKCHSDIPDTQSFCGDCGTQLTPSGEAPASFTKTLETPVDDLAPGILFAGRYEVMAVLGKGGMGKVYQAVDTKTNEELAIKLIRPEIASESKTIERFSNELALAHKVSHRHVCRMFHLGEDNGTHYITMEYIHGDNLKKTIQRKGKLSDKEAISIAKQVCEGLSEAHELGVIHRDLKPSNIMIDESGQAKIMDFGIARSLAAPGVTQTGVIIGTPDYISPEQAEGEEADQRSDIYSLGVVLYEMVTGSVPFKGDTAFSVAFKHKSQLPEHPKKLNPDVSDDLARLILICLEKDRNRRYQMAEELLADLKNIEEGFPLGTKIRPKREIFAAKLIRNRLFFPVLAVILIIFGIIIWQLLPRGSTDAFTSIAVMPFDDLSPAKDQEYRCNGIAEEIRHRISQLGNVNVPGRISSMMLKGQDIKEIGSKLNVETVLEGSLQKTGERIIFIVTLINVSNAFTLWTKKFEGNENDIIHIQDEISLAIVDKLRLNLFAGEKDRLLKRKTDNPKAFDKYLQGRSYMDLRSYEGLQTAIEYFNQAIEIDPNFAYAYSGLSQAYSILGGHWYIPPHEAFSRAKIETMKALHIDDRLAEAHADMGFIYGWADWDWPAAEKSFKKAIQLKDSYPDVHQWYGQFLVYMGRVEAGIAELRKAVELDPLSLPRNTFLGFGLVVARRYDEAIEQLQMVLKMNPNFAYAYDFISQAYEQKSMHTEAITATEKAINIEGQHPMRLCFLAYYYALADEKDQALKILEDLRKKYISKEAYISPSMLSLVYIGLGQKDEAFSLLERAYKERDYGLIYLKMSSIYDRFRDDPRFQDLMRRMNFPDDN